MKTTTSPVSCSGRPSGKRRIVALRLVLSGAWGGKLSEGQTHVSPRVISQKTETLQEETEATERSRREFFRCMFGSVEKTNLTADGRGLTQIGDDFFICVNLRLSAVFHFYSKKPVLPLFPLFPHFFNGGRGRLSRGAWRPNLDVNPFLA